MGGITGLLILIIIVLIFTGANKLPKLGEGLGRTVRNFKRSLSEPDEVDITPREPGKDGKGDKGDQPKN
ncbi:MAG: twin-arginine translocase TatA/TatE family subunit [Humidesulfovibrio sp.]|jgi:sec-independent protein translocase protein TatA|nr:twin-arginine translocase TatA/TatE family subunit [Humidesulfovibrio sp.]PKN09598.1 MAG: twin-arginine translocase TatA/TatE family subunit [Deltaproteobacteria bacterium HGW-Deltaproteobacteria-8]